MSDKTQYRVKNTGGMYNTLFSLDDAQKLAEEESFDRGAVMWVIQEGEVLPESIYYVSHRYVFDGDVKQRIAKLEAQNTKLRAALEGVLDFALVFNPAPWIVEEAQEALEWTSEESET